MLNAIKKVASSRSRGQGEGSMGVWELRGSITSLPRGLNVDLHHPKIIRYSELPPEILAGIETENYSLKHLIRSPVGQLTLLERYGKNYWIFWPVPGSKVDDSRIEVQQKEFVVDDYNTNKDWSQLGFSELLTLWKEDVAFRSLKASVKLNMTVPEAIGTLSNNDQNNAIEVSPEKYLESKYYECLFFIHLPLAYFVKSNLERFKTMCKSTSTDDVRISYKKCLLDLLLENKDFDNRHDGNNLFKINLGSPVAAKKKDNCLDKYGIVIKEDDQDTILDDLCLVLKAREIKLQIVLLLENIYLDGLDLEFKDFEANYRTKLERRSLNVTRFLSYKSRRSVSSGLKKEKCNQKPDFCEQLDLYLDKLCIIDLFLASEPFKATSKGNKLQEQKKSMLNKNNEASSIGFTNYVLLPYFTRKLPFAVRFIVRKLKGPSLRSKRAVERKVLPKPLESIMTSSTPSVVPQNLVPSSRVTSSPSSPYQRLSSSFISQNTMSSADAGFINGESSSNLNSLYEKSPRIPSFISRTSSDLTINHLQKRQLSVTELVPQTLRSEVTSSLDGTANFFSPQHSFRRVGKRKINGQDSRSAPISAYDEEQSDAIQVISTPIKKLERSAVKRVKLQNIVESPNQAVDSQKSSARGSNSISTQRDQLKEGLDEETQSKKVVKRRLFAP